MSDRMTRRMTLEEIRDRCDYGDGDCSMCFGDLLDTHEPETHRPGCPCDPQNVVVSREVLAQAYAALFPDAPSQPQPRDVAEWVTRRAALQAAMKAALGEELTP